MKFTIERQGLLSALKSIHVVVPSRSVSSVTTCFLFEIEHNDTLKVSCTDMTHSAYTSVKLLSCDGGFTLAVPAERLISVLSLMNGDTVTMGFKTWDGRMVVTDGQDTFKLAVTNEKFPDLNLDFTDKNEIGHVPESWLLKTLAGIEFAAPKQSAVGAVDNSKCIMLDTYDAEHGGEVTCIAGTGIAIAKARCPDCGKTESHNPIALPSLRIIKGLLKPRDSMCVLYKVDNHLVFRTENTTFSVALKAESFPDTKVFFSRVGDTTGAIVVDADDLQGAMRRVMVLDTQLTSTPLTVTMNASGDTLELSAESQAGTYNGTIGCKKSGSCTRIGLRCQYVLSACSLMSGDVTIRMSLPRSPVYIMAEGFDMVIMPVYTPESNA